ncbi:MAG: DciA family protein [Pelagibacteraceae bacterium]
MHNKKVNNSKSQNFLQGLRPFSSSIPSGFKKILKKSGYNFSTIVDNWTKIVGKKISNSCYPIKVRFEKNASNGTIVVMVRHGNELDIEYNKREILDKINAFFGYNCMKEIKLKIMQDKLNLKNRIEKKVINKDNFEKKIKNISDIKLKNSLKNLIKAYNGKND